MKRLLLVGLLLFSLTTAAQAATMVSGLGGISGYGENQLADNDDNSTDFLDLTSVFTSGLNFFGTTYTGLYLNNNGNVTFSSKLLTFTPYNLTGPTGNPIIAPFFGDVDTRGAGDLFYDFDTSNNVFSATWDAVGFYNFNRFPTNSFQLRLIDRGSGDFDIEFRYEALGWTAGEESAGVHARAGYNSGNGTDYYELAESGDSTAMLDLVNRSNVGVAGIFQWEVRGGSVATGTGADITPGGGGTTTVPEPSTLLLLGSGMAGLAYIRRKFKKRQ